MPHPSHLATAEKKTTSPISRKTRSGRGGEQNRDVEDTGGVEILDQGGHDFVGYPTRLGNSLRYFKLTPGKPEDFMP